MSEAKKAVNAYRRKALRAAEIATELGLALDKRDGGFMAFEAMSALARMGRELEGLAEEARASIRQAEHDSKQLGLVLEAPSSKVPA